MLDALKFVAGAVAKKDMVEALTHFKIKDGFVQAFNGQISCASRIDLGLDVMPWATDMVNAIQACNDTVALSVTPTGRLAVRSGKFKCFVECMDMKDDILQMFPTPSGAFIEIGDEFITMLRELEPFMANDASRPWAMGVMLESNSAFATNNVMLAQYWHGIKFPCRVTIPAEAVKEINKRSDHVTGVQVDDNSLTVWFGRERWMRTQLLPDAFPDQIHTIAERAGDEAPLPLEHFEGLFEGLETLKKFLGDNSGVYFLDGIISTTKDPEHGASVEVGNIPTGPLFNHKYLSLLKETAKAIDFSQYPRPGRFLGKNPRLRGVFMGMNQ